MKIIYITLLFNLVLSHSNLRQPIPRGNIEHSSYCSYGLGCNGPCEATISESSFTKPFYPKKIIKRGEKIQVEWLRQNHPGGFVRLAMVPFEQSDNKVQFDNNVIKFVCYETNCGENQHDDFLGSLNGKGDGLCSTSFIVPDNLPDGPVTLQWIWFGGGIYFAKQDTGFANYFNCADMQILGGNTYNPNLKASPTFQGGDIANKNNKDQCRYWGRNNVDHCPQGSENGDQCGKLSMMNGKPDYPNLKLE